MKSQPSVLVLFLCLAASVQAGSRLSANYSAVTETVDITGGISSSASYSTIASSGVVAGVAINGASTIQEKRGYIGQLDEVASPEIQVSQPALSNIPDGGSRDFGSVPVGAAASLVFTIKNAGVTDLTGLAPSLDGPDAGMFLITAAPVSPVAGPLGTTTFTVQFAPTASGSRSASLHIASNDPDENPFDIILTGTAIAPEIAIEQPAGNSLTSDSGVPIEFGPVIAASSRSLAFTIRNDGPAVLTGLAVTTTPDGTPGDFSIIAPGVTALAPNTATTFTVIFSPSATGTRSATLLVASNDEDENPFRINLTGAQATDSQAWRITYFGTHSNSGPGADLNDPDGDGIANMLEYATATDPTVATLPPGELVKNGNTLEFTYTRRKAALAEMAFVREFTDALDDTWRNTGSSSLQTILSDDGTLQTVRVNVPAGSAGKRFVRLRVSRL